MKNDLKMLTVAIVDGKMRVDLTPPIKEILQMLNDMSQPPAEEIPPATMQRLRREVGEVFQGHAP